MLVGTVGTGAAEVSRVVGTADRILVVNDEIEVEVNEGSEEEAVGAVDEDSKISFWAPKMCQFEFLFGGQQVYQKPNQNCCCILVSSPTYLRRHCFRQVLI